MEKGPKSYSYQNKCANQKPCIEILQADTKEWRLDNLERPPQIKEKPKEIVKNLKVETCNGFKLREEVG